MSSLCWFFFFSSRRRHTRLVSDWSSDVCSSDLQGDDPLQPRGPEGDGPERRAGDLERAARNQGHSEAGGDERADGPHVRRGEADARGIGRAAGRGRGGGSRGRGGGEKKEGDGSE